MSFRLDDIIVDRIQMAVAMDFNDNPLYTLTQLSDATINISAESKDAVDRDGTLIKRFWQGKTGTFEATNAMLNLNIIGSMSGPVGTGKKEASVANPITMPAIKIVKAGSAETVVLNDYIDADNIISTYKPNTAKIIGMSNNGAKSANVYTPTSSSTVTSSTFKVSENGVCTLPTADGGKYLDDQFVITYERYVTSGAMIENRADKFPSTVRLLMKVLYVDPCTADTLRAGYIYLPSFQVSPEVEITFDTEGNITYSGDLQVDYCGSEKVLYKMFFCEADSEDE